MRKPVQVQEEDKEQEEDKLGAGMAAPESPNREQ
jgi:hypothetical protein